MLTLAVNPETTVNRIDAPRGSVLSVHIQNNNSVYLSNASSKTF